MTPPTPPSAHTHLRCPRCDARFPAAAALDGPCARCGGPLLARYDLEAAARTFPRSARALDERPRDLRRFAELLPLERPDEAPRLGEGLTPLLPAPRLSAALGVTVLLKDEARNPTGSFKARGMAVAVARAKELGARLVAAPSAGNAGVALSAYAARAGVRARVYLPRDVHESVEPRCRAYGAEIESVDGFVTDAGKALLRDIAADPGAGLANLATFREPCRVEGKKTMGLELWADLDGAFPDVVVYPTGGGVGLIGIAKAAEELAALGLAPRGPRFVAVQVDVCAPIARAFETGAARASPPAVDPGAARTKAFGLRVPGTLADEMILSILRRDGGLAVAVSEGDLDRAASRLAREEGVHCGPEAATTLAGLERAIAAGAVRPGERVVLLLTG